MDARANIKQQTWTVGPFQELIFPVYVCDKEMSWPHHTGETHQPDWVVYVRGSEKFRLTNVIPERIIFVSRGITVFGLASSLISIISDGLNVPFTQVSSWAFWLTRILSSSSSRGNRDFGNVRHAHFWSFRWDVPLNFFHASCRSVMTAQQSPARYAVNGLHDELQELLLGCARITVVGCSNVPTGSGQRRTKR